MMNPPKDPPPDKKSLLHWVLCPENWEDLVIIVIPDLNTTPIEGNYSNVSTQDIRSYFDGPHSQCRKSRKKPKGVKKNVLYPSSLF